MDQSAVEEFLGKMLGDLSGAMAVGMAFLGDRLGLFKDLATNGATDSATLAARTGMNERYVREWLGGMTNAGYIDYDAAAGSWSLPPERAVVLASEQTPASLGGFLQMLHGDHGMLTMLPAVAEKCRAGGGISQAEYGPDFWEGLTRATSGWFEGLLVPVWIAGMPAVQTRLEDGCSMADVGCGWGHALITLAKAYPNSTFVGYDVFGPCVEAATEAARDAGVGDRVSFEQLDGSGGLPSKHDVIATFDVVHDAADPGGLVTSIHDALEPGGHYVCLDINCSPDLEDMNGPFGTMFHGFSMTYCMTTSLAGGGVGLGTVGLHEPKFRELCDEAGFTSVERIEIDNPFNNLYLATA
jgi:SAM-dependent methyltransferase